MGILGLKFGSDSQSTTTNEVSNYDQKQYNTNSWDSHDANMTDNSISSSITNITDGGAIAGMVSIVGSALEGANRQTIASYDYADSIFNAATNSVDKASARVSNAYDRAALVTSDALLTVRDAYKDTTARTVDAFKVAQAATADAYADAKGTTNSQKQIMIGVLVVAGLMALAAMQRKAG
jgi:hypothetical protein